MAQDEVACEGVECVAVTVGDATQPADDIRRATKPYMYEKAKVYNASPPPRCMKLVKSRHDDAISMCSASEAGTVLATVHQATKVLVDSQSRAMDVDAFLKIGVMEGKVKMQYHKVKMSCEVFGLNLNLRNVHFIMVIGGLYPPTDRPPPATNLHSGYGRVCCMG